MLRRKENQSFFPTCREIRPDLYLPEHGGQERGWRVKNAELPHDYHQITWHCSALGPLLACFFPLLPQKHSRSTSRYGFLPIREEPNKGRKILQNKLHFSHFFGRGLSIQDDFNVVLGLGGKFLFTWLGWSGRERDTGEWAFFISHSLLQLLYLCLLQTENRRKKSNWDVGAFQHISQRLSRSTGSSQDREYEKEARRSRKLCLITACVKWSRLKKKATPSL